MGCISSCWATSGQSPPCKHRQTSLVPTPKLITLAQCSSLLRNVRSRDEEFNAAGFDKISFNYFLEDEDFPGG